MQLRYRYRIRTGPGQHGERLPPAVDDTDAEVELSLDLGLNMFATDQHGSTPANPRVLRRAERRLRKARQALSRNQKGSANRARVRVRSARLHAQVAGTRADRLRKVTAKMTRPAKSVHDANWARFVSLPDYKAARYGRTVVTIDRFPPSGKTCSCCGALRDTPLAERTHRCRCGLTPDRGHNAALNILAAGRAERLNACGGRVRPLSGVARAAEAGTRRSAS